MQCHYGNTYPTCLRLSLDSYSSNAGFNVVDYYRECLNIDYVISDDMIFDFYAFESDDVKKGTNVSRLIHSLRQLEIGDHVCPGYVSLFRMMYSSHIDEPLKFLKLQHDYNSIVSTTTSTPTHSAEAVLDEQHTRRRGRKRRNPTKIIDEYGREQTKRQRWYDRQNELVTQQQQQQQQPDQHDDHYNNTVVLEDDIDSILHNILQSVASGGGDESVAGGIGTSSSLSKVDDVGLGQGAKNISRFTTPPPSPPRRRSRKSRSYYNQMSDDRYTLMMSNVIL